MIVAIHQPNYMPYLKYFYKMAESDIFIFMDNAQYTRGSWINRVKVKGIESSIWLTVPVKYNFGQNISKVEIVNQKKWARKHLKTLKSLYGNATHFMEFYPTIENILGKTWNSLADLNIEIIESICKILKINTRLVIGSEFNCEGHTTDLLVNMVKEIGGDTYLCGKAAYQEDWKFAENDLKLIRQKYEHPVYRQLHGEFIEGLSILDALFNIGSKKIEWMLSNSITFTPLRDDQLSELSNLDTSIFDIAWVEENFLREMPNKKFLSQVVYSRGSIIGYIVGSSYHGKGHIHRLAVKPNYRRIGLGTNLVESFIDNCTEMNFSNVTVETPADNTENDIFYRSLGFRTLGADELKRYLIQKEKLESMEDRKVYCYPLSFEKMRIR